MSLDGEEFFTYSEKSEKDIKSYFASKMNEEIRKLRERYPNVPEVQLTSIYIAGVQTGKSMVKEMLAVRNQEQFDFEI